MGVLDKFLSIMKLDDGDDEYDDDEFFDDDEYDDDYEEKPKRSLFHKNTKDNDKDFDEDDEDDYTAPVKSKSAFSNNKVTPAEKRLMMKATKTITSFLPSLSSVRPVLIIK